MTENLPTLPTHSMTDGEYSSSVVDQHSWDDLEMPNNQTAWIEPGQGKTFDLSVLWQVLERHKEQMKEKEDAGKNISTTWELIVVQGVLLTLLVMVSVCWALCCRRRSSNPTVAEALRKLSNSPSKELPPSYSMMDLYSLGLSVHDHLNPPPDYPGDNLQYLDLEAGHRRLSRLSFSSSDGVPARLGRLSVASCESCSSVVLPDRTGRFSMCSESSESSSSRRDSRASRVSFSEDVECSAGSIRRLSSNTLYNMQANSNSSSRKSSSSSEGSRRSSLISKVQRKMGSNNTTGSFIDNLDEELQQKLASIGETEVTAELQTERVDRVCDIIVEEK